MATIAIEELFDNNRFPGGLGMVALCVYFPVGVLLAVLRLFIGLHAYLIAWVLPKTSTLRSSVLRSMCGVLGIWVTQEGMENRDRNVKVLVANYTSTLDHLAVNLLIPSILPCVWDLPSTLMWILGYTDLGAKQGREVLIQSAKKQTRESKVPILVFPEGASTNGNVGLLKFSIWPFSLDQPVQPILIKLHRPPIGRITPSVLGGRWWIDVFWYLFVPYTHFSVRVLPALENEDGSAEEFTRRTQEVMAKKLGIQPTQHTSADKVEYAKKKFHIESQTASQFSPSPGTSTGLFGDTRVEIMTHQVKEVLPHVPVEAIKADLALTKDVDLTITNFIEGRVAFTPEGNLSEPTSPQTPTPTLRLRQQQPQSSLTSPPKANTAAKAFARNPNDRHLSLVERKAELLEIARQRYKAKQGLQ